MFSTERYYNKYYGLRVTPADEIEKVKSEKYTTLNITKKQKIQGVSSYNILENPRYQEIFFY